MARTAATVGVGAAVCALGLGFASRVAEAGAVRGVAGSARAAAFVGLGCGSGFACFLSKARAAPPNTSSADMRWIVCTRRAAANAEVGQRIPTRNNF